MKFVDEPELKMLRNGDWQLRTPLTYISSSYYIVAVPAGFITDLASVPRILQSWVPQHGAHSLAAIIHDYLYATQPISRKHADDMFLEALEDSGVGLLRRYALYAGVRVGGWIAWGSRKRDREANAENYRRLHGIG